MTRFSQPSFLGGPPQPLVLTMDGQGRTPFELYRLIASPAQPSFLLDSGKRTDSGSQFSFLGSSPFSVLTGRQGRASLRTREGREYSSEDPFGSLCRLFVRPQIEPPPGLPSFLGRSRRLLQLRSRPRIRNASVHRQRRSAAARSTIRSVRHHHRRRSSNRLSADYLLSAHGTVFRRAPREALSRGLRPAGRMGSHD